MTVDTLSVAGKTALITGSGRENGIGAAIARALARNGASVAIHHVSESTKSRAEKVAADLEKEFGVKMTVVHGSVSDYNTTHEMVRQALKGLGTDHIDILGKWRRGPPVNYRILPPSSPRTIKTVLIISTLQSTMPRTVIPNLF